MRVKVGKKSGFINIAKFPVKSIRILNSEMVSLLVEVGIDVTACLNENIQIATLDTYGQNIPVALPTLLIDNFTDGIRAATSTDAKEKTRITELRNAKKISTTFLDITKFVSNQSIKSVREGDLKKIEVIKTFESDISLNNTNDFELEQPEDQDFTNVENFCYLNISRGVDPALTKGSFPLIDPINYDKRTLKKSKDKLIKNFKIIGQSKKYTKGIYETRFTPCLFEIKVPRLSISKLPVLYSEIKFTNNFGTIISIEKFSFSNQSIESDLKMLETRNSQTNLISYARLINQKLDAVQNPYIATNSSFLRRRDESKFFGTRIVRNISGKYHKNTKITFIRPKLQKIPKNTSQNIIPFVISKIDGGIKISIENIRKNIVSIGIEKRNATLNTKFEKLQGEGLDITLVDEGSSIDFYDLNLKHDYLYEYRIFYIDDNGNFNSSSNIVCYHYASTTILDPASLSIAEINREIIEDNLGTYPVISFDIEASLTSNGIEVVKEFLAANNIDEKTLGMPELETGNYKKLLMYQVDRQNLRTGDIETFGTSASSTFVDDSASPKNLRTIKPLNILDSYKYIVRLGLRDPEALIPVQRTSKTPVSIGKNSYNFRSYKFKINSKRGLIPSNLNLESDRSRSLDENFMEFSLGIEANVTINAENYFPTIVGLNVRKTLLGFNLLEWSTNGDIESIDHFRVYAIADGIEAYVGSAHPHITDGSYFYEDYEMFDRIGEVTYRVVPVLLNYEESSGDSQVSIINESNLPIFLR